MRVLRSTLSIFGATLVAIALGAAHPARAAEATVTIAPGARAFEPQQLAIRPGDRVRWVNDDRDEHFLTSTGPASGPPVSGVEGLMIHRLLQPGASYSHLFSDAETYYYFCAIHLQMWGVVTVEP